MRLSELATRSGVSTATIKYYLRLGLLHPGEQQSTTWSVYGPSHLRRLGLVRALVEVGGLSLDAVRRVLAVVDDEQVPRHEAFGTAQWLLTPTPEAEPSRVSAQRVDALLARHDWALAPGSPHRAVLAALLDRLDELTFPATDGQLDAYAEALDALAPDEVARVADDADRSTAVEHLVIGTVLYERLLTTMRRMAHEAASARVVRRT